MHNNYYISIIYYTILSNMSWCYVKIELYAKIIGNVY